LTFDQYIETPQFAFSQPEKEQYLFGFLKELHAYHAVHSADYQRIVEKIFPKAAEAETVSDLPFLPVSLYKTHALKSIADADVFKVLTSSGTTGSVPSRIFLDKDTAQLQSRALTKIMTHVLGNERLPMLIVDSKSVLRDRASFSARGAGILGMSVFGRKHQYILDDNMALDTAALTAFLEENNGKPMLIFGFTFLVWQFLYLAINSESAQKSLGFKPDFSQAVLIHSGGWKKLQEMAVDNDRFKLELESAFGLKKIYNFYGMVEQVGSVFLENKLGFLHCPNFSDVIIRNPNDFSVQPDGEAGLIQVVSMLPKSYPGHSILTEDLGVVVRTDNPEAVWKGKYFKILGRAKKAELRGCSDTFSVKN
jgi:phenylacetate-coenzyme A ligase PaaK-like adenylate-forming protein